MIWNNINHVKQIHTVSILNTVISIEKFNIYAEESAILFVDNYPWFYMPPSVHKVLIHGEVIKHSILSLAN